MNKLSPKQKALIALAALRGEKISKLSSNYQVHPNQICKWKKLAEEDYQSNERNGTKRYLPSGKAAFE